MSYRYIIFFSIILGIFIVFDLYIWKGYSKTVQQKRFSIFKWLIPFSSLLFLAGFAINLYRGSNGIYNANPIINIFFGTSLGFFVAKLIAAIFLLTEDIVRISFWIKNLIFKKDKKEKNFASRRNFVRNISLGMASLPILGSIYAVTKGKYNFHIKRLDLSMKRLPASFDGLQVIQFSDFHAGSFDDFESVEYGLSLINKENPDLILFTGDLVNNRAAEMLPYIESMKKLSAKYGKFAVLGNHDYGDYVPFENEAARQANLDYLESIFKEAGFKLLKNESIQINNGQEEIDLIGLENWGEGPFPKYGDIDLASINTPYERFNIVMSHDPDHWENELRMHKKQFDLTLSGHTHGSQIGIEIPGWKWSPVKYRYKRWLGLYEENDQYLFVSKGFGFLGFPGRIGMSPEIIKFKLHANKA
ncbi:metallophosphoesterase [Brumimicrobium aurantiacum]|uniref:Metallophosphoesterase n=1 Tax=Brumimicrobium aurantiacum TaxID=1737063 RepID=A0A3E1F0K5_9FLAO|nr:metallophosphoesterase [Brumimicrobium aurantiacum]RFC55247.1 metallophosphoesterase [Brumimicrobium aurantiacum]